jgi:hypothetical protein
MESAPLTQAHAHVRNAVLETKRSNPVAASEEHDLAAAEFATAAQGTADSEALRILTLLEQQHRHLGHILKSRHEKPAAKQETAAEVASAQLKSESASKGISPTTQATVEAAGAGAEASHSPPRLARPPRATARDLSSSIANNLASARGIPRDRLRKPTPITPTVSVQHAGGNFAREQAGPYARTGSERPDNARKPSWAPPSNTSDEKDTNQVDTPSSDAPFQQFYSTFENLISKLSAPLAFAGLPLTSPTASKTPSIASSTKSKRPQTPPISSTTPVDYSQLISRAALNALRDGPAYHNPAESFYVVPTTGGTISYAEVMSRAEREQSGQSGQSGHRRTLSGISETTSDDFVDARGTILNGKRPPSRKGPLGNESRIIEEQSMQIDALKRHIDALSKRLHVFELSSQSSTAALAQSIRSLPRSPGITPENSRGKERESKRIAELEALLEKNAAELRKRKEESAELKTVVKRYREKWEKLKEGARARRGQDGGMIPSTPTAERGQEDGMEVE